MRAVSDSSGLRRVAIAGFTGFDAEITFSTQEIVVSGDWAFARNEVDGSVRALSGGDPFLVDVKQLVVFHRQTNGSWKIARLIMNSNRE